MFPALSDTERGQEHSNEITWVCPSDEPFSFLPSQCVHHGNDAQDSEPGPVCMALLTTGNVWERWRLQASAQPQAGVLRAPSSGTSSAQELGQEAVLRGEL